MKETAAQGVRPSDGSEHLDSARLSARFKSSHPGHIGSCDYGNLAASQSLLIVAAPIKRP